MDTQQSDRSPFWRSAAGLAALGFGAVAAYFLFTEHRAHLFGILPWLLILTCPVMMMFMHRGHKHHEQPDQSPGHAEPSSSPPESGRRDS
jgi:hypothetical protein